MNQSFNNSYTKTRYSYDKKRQLTWSIVAPYLQKKFKISGRILDLGCGYGDFINNIKCDSKYAMDINKEMAVFLDKDTSFTACATGELSKFFKKEELDWVFSSNLLEHLTRLEIDRLFDDLNYLLATGGKVMFLMPNYRLASKEYFDDYTHITPLSDRSLSDWLSAKGFEVLFVHPNFLPFSIKNSRIPVFPILIKAWLKLPFNFFGKQMLLVAKKQKGSFKNET